MCGLYGFATIKPDSRYIGAFKALGLLMEDRGRQATGYASYIYSKMPVIDKDVTNATMFYAGKFINPNSYMCMGHTRFGTKGANIRENAHPFSVGRVVGAHNGILANDNEIELAHNTKFAVDSQAVFYLLDKYGNDYIKALGEVRGSMALTWTHQGTDGHTYLYMFRHCNPLHIAYTDDKKCIFWASESVALEIVLASLNQDNNATFSLLEDHAVGLMPDLELVALTDKEIKLKEYIAPKQLDTWKTGHVVGGYMGNKKKHKHSKWEQGTLDGFDQYTKSPDYEYDPETGLYKPKEDTKSSKVADTWSYDDRVSFVNQYGREFAKDYGCKICHNEIQLVSPFYVNTSTDKLGDTYHVGCFKKKQACSFDDVLMIVD